ncbi:MAG: ABC transporter permease subunit [Candidatus Borkfalkiaceae bacterium]|nr:ABC transporter permease subunit [Christensenellaceae bacterium]
MADNLKTALNTDRNVKKRSWIKAKDYIIRFWPLYVMLLPLLVYLLIFNYYPMFGLQLAFKDWYIRKGIWGSPWATTDGTLDLFKYFNQLFSTSMFGEKLINTLRISFLKMLFGFPAPIILVLALNELSSLKFAKFVQSISYIPHFLSWVVLGGIFLSLDKSEIFQSFMTALTGGNVHFFSNDDLYIGFLVFSDIYKEVGWGTIIYLASLMNIDPQLYEAAALDGAGRFKKIWYITLPGLVPAISINAILTLSNVMYAGFDQIYNTYNDVLSGKGETLEMYLFRLGVTGGDYSISTAIGLFNSVVGCILVIITNFVTKAMGGDGIW